MDSYLKNQLRRNIKFLITLFAAIILCLSIRFVYINMKLSEYSKSIPIENLGTIQENKKDGN